MPSFCVVANCEFKYVHSPNISFHKFPFHTDSLLRKWIQFTDRGEFWLPSRWSSICSRHFLPNDFRDHVSRKCLKRSAVPSITIKSIDCSSISSLSTANNKIADFAQSMCRLCARTFIGTVSRTRNLEDPLVAAALYKCCPTVPLHLDEALPQMICSECSSQLNRFATFVDRIVSVQADLLQRFGLGEPIPEMMDANIVQTQCQVDEPNAQLESSFDCMQPPNFVPRMFKIKQEPFINVKQEIVESARSVANPGIDLIPDSDAFCEFCEAYFTNNLELKNHIVKYHSNDDGHQPVPNSCEIMEIITLGNAFINLAEEDNGAERLDADLQHSSDMIPLEQVLKVEHLTEYEQREQREQIRQVSVVLDEHCYSRLQETGAPTMESPDEQFRYGNPEIYTITSPADGDQSFQQAELSILYQCSDCCQQFACQNLLDEHIQIHTKSDGLDLEMESTDLLKPAPKRFASSQALDGRLKSRRCRRQRSRRAFRCRLCRRLFGKLSRLRMHESHCVRSNGKKARQERVRNMECTKIGGRFVCSLCDRTYGRRSNFNRHFVSHRPRSQWSSKCPHCDELFDRDSDVTLHLRSRKCKSHSPNVRLSDAPPENLTTILANQDNSSKITVESIASPPTPQIHLQSPFKSAISTRPPLDCNSCPKSLKNVQNQRPHQVTHQSDAKFACSMCDKVFKRMAGLNQHVNGFHYKIKRHVCSVCNYSYALKGDMTRCRHSTLKSHIE